MGQHSLASPHRRHLLVIVVAAALRLKHKTSMVWLDMTAPCIPALPELHVTTIQLWPRHLQSFSGSSVAPLIQLCTQTRGMSLRTWLLTLKARHHCWGPRARHHE
jgi:hypothetical protein